MNITDNTYKAFSPSVNIIRDQNVDLNYIVTPNSLQVYKQIVKDYKIGTRAFNLVGAYGTGKSAFLKALLSDLENSTNYFQNKFTTSINSFDVIKFVGTHGSLTNVFAKHFGISSSNTEDILKCLTKLYKESEEKNKGIIIVIDEFGKFLEFAAKNNPDTELYFIQQLAEYVNDPAKNILLISTLHQDFSQYAYTLNKTQQNEWDKVKGRLKEITFNEPVEQLLFLAAKRTAQLSFNKDSENANELFKAINKSRLFPLRDYFTEEIAKELVPFDLLSAAALTLALQNYGQNERSLFSFLESNDPYGISSFDLENNKYFNLSNVYDYLIHNYYTFLTSKFNPHFAQWTNIRVAIERIEGFYSGEKANAINIVKTIGLLNIFSSASGHIDPDFLDKYARYTFSFSNTAKVLEELTVLRVIRYVEFSSRYKIWEGTDLDIEKELLDAAVHVEAPRSLIPYLSEFFNFHHLSAKSVFHEKGTPRIFSFQLVDRPVTLTPEGEIDGYIQLIFDTDSTLEDVINLSENCNEAIIFVLYKNTSKIQNAIYEILKIRKVKADHIDDKIATEELTLIEDHHIMMLNKLVLEDLYSNEHSVDWIIQGQRREINGMRDLNRWLSRLSDNIYHAVPIYKNEMVNKTKISSAISTARKMMMRHLTGNWNSPQIGYLPNTFPPDKTIYLSLISQTGIHYENNNGSFDLGEPNDPSFAPLWHLGIDFLNSAKHSKRNLGDFVQQMSTKPFKLKQGFIDFWIPIFLYINRNDFALFSNDIYIPELTDETLELVSRDPQKFEVKAFDVQGIRLALFNQYRKLLQQSEKEKLSNQSFIETIKPFLKFYAKDINYYSKNTERISLQSIRLRAAIAQSTDPEKAFFEDFPAAMGYSLTQLQKDEKLLGNYVTDLQLSIKEIRFSYTHLIERFENFLAEDILGKSNDFETYKSELQNRFSAIKRHFLKPEQKAFIQRINSPLDDRIAWLNSLVQVCLGKTLENISDDEEIRLYSLFTEMIRELDNLCDLSKQDFDEANENVFQIEITSFVDGLKKNLVRLPKNKNKEVENKEAELKLALSKDSRVNIAVLTSLLQKELKK
ncbi:AAA family ATPase [Flavobacterium sp. MK4S-17]|uniref:AAA family ATPase n=1 Tax=Flavobacterium sp. MK4S-17 TaxID=2543737 RepID=UPI001358E2B9|nr:AAA family ATPase [Flavobacterium sp. MK4S-17]